MEKTTFCAAVRIMLGYQPCYQYSKYGLVSLQARIFILIERCIYAIMQNLHFYMSFRPESLGANDEQDVADEEATTFDLDDEQIGGDWIFGKKDSLLSENPSANQLRDSGYRKVFATRRKEPGSPWDSLELKRVTDKCALQDNRGGWHAHAGIFALRAVDFYTQLWLENLDLKEDDRYWEAIDAALFAFRVGDSVKDCECYWIKERA